MINKFGIIGKKIGMTRIFDENGYTVPVTIIQAGPCKVIEKRTLEKNGYVALQLGYIEKPERLSSKPILGQFKKINVNPFRIVKEIRVSSEIADKFNIGDDIKADIYKTGDWVDVIGRSKGRGFAGVIKRHGFGGSKDSHGAHEYFRHGGSIGQNMTPGHSFKGIKMPGHYGNEQITAQNLKVIKVIPDENIILVKGAIPGFNNSIVTIRWSSKKKTPKFPRD